MTSITPEQLNLLIFRHLEESGFSNCASDLENEADIDRDGDRFPHGALLKLVQKGIQHCELEANLNQDEIRIDGEQLLHPFDLIKCNPVELQMILKDRKEKFQKGISKGKGILGSVQEEQRKQVKLDGNPILPSEFANIDVIVLPAHTSEVLACAWNPAQSLLASRSRDPTARIWNIDDPSYLNFELKHCKDVTSIDWNFDGSMLATGSRDGIARIWSPNGQLAGTYKEHKGSILCVKWNKENDTFVTGSTDKTAILWDVKLDTWTYKFEVHKAPIVDVDWRTNDSFATCSIDNFIHVWELSSSSPAQTFTGHEAAINAIEWDPTGTLLASCSVDSTAKIWTQRQSKCFLDFKEHSQEVSSLTWSPTGPQTNNPNQKLLLATASYDATVKLWDLEAQRHLKSLDGHKNNVHSIAFSPNGEYLASGSTDGSMHVWSVNGRIVRTYNAVGGVFHVCWNKEGNKIAAGLKNNLVCVIDCRM